MRKKVLSWILTVALVLSLFTALPFTAHASDYECQNVQTSTYYDTLDQALIDVADGQTIKLLKDVTYEAMIGAYTKSFTLNVNGWSLSVTAANATCLYAGNGYDLTITDGAGGGSVALSASGGSGLAGLYANGYGSEININVPASVNVTGDSSYGVYAITGGIVTITGDITVTGTSSYGAYADSGVYGSLVTIDGRIDSTNYVYVNGHSFSGPEECIAPTTKEGYYTFLDTGDSANPQSTVWVKAAAAPVVLDLADGNIVIKSNSYDFGTSTNIQNNSNSYIVTQSNPDLATTNTVTIQDNAEAIVTINGININTNICAFGVSSGSKVTLTLSGANYLKSGADRAGLEVPMGAELVVSGTTVDTLNVIGGDYAAGIGGGRGSSGGTITIEGGVITATGGNAAGGTGSGAGIGGGRGGSGGTITIDGGEINATGGYRAAGIGGGTGGSSGIILIKDGSITASAAVSSYSAGIGGGYNGKLDSITIEGGTVEATGDSGAGIGGGMIQSTPPTTDGGTINISGGTITAQSGGPGIGGNLMYITYNMPTTINITGGTITATSSSHAGICSNEGTINISGGDISAVSYSYGAGIGGSYGRSNGGTINISDGIINASGGTLGAGIGGGYGGDVADAPGTTINISGGDITATGGADGGAGIGGGYGTTAGEITITGGNITAHGNGGKAIGIGALGWAGTGGEGAIIISQAVVNASVENTWDELAINAGPDGTIHIGFTGEPSEWICDPIDSRAEVNFVNSSFSPNGLVLGTCLIDGAGEIDGSYIEGVKVVAPPFIGSGTIDDPYQVATAEQLAYINEYLDMNYIQTADIDLSEYNDGIWTPIGTEADPFSGSFDGGNYTIEGLTVDQDTYYAGLFGIISEEAALENISLSDVSVEGTWYVGGLVGSCEGSVNNCFCEGSVNGTGRYVGGLVGHNTGIVSGGSFEGAVSGSDYKVGGLVGRNRGVIQDVTIDNIQVTGPDYVGGLTGRNLPYYTEESGYDYDTGIIINCHVGANAIITGNTTIGGFAGDNTTGIIEHCSSLATVSGTYRVGGMVGSNSGTVTECFSGGSVTGNEDLNGDTGGLTGNNWGTVENCYSFASATGPKNVGGLIGRNGGTVTNCYSAGIVTGTGIASNIGGIIGNQQSGTVSNCYWDYQTSTISASGAGVACTTADMKVQATFADWNFADIWTISAEENDGYPALAWQGFGSASSDDTFSITASGQYPFGGGNGSTAESAYEISTAEQLAQLAFDVNNGNDYSDKYFKLTADIDLAGKQWTPIGYRFYPGGERGFNGSFDGGGYDISNLIIGTEAEPKTGGNQTQAGLFGAIKYNAILKNISVTVDIHTDGVTNVGGLVGYSEADGTVSNCSVGGNISIKGEDTNQVGGLIGYVENTSISECSSNVTITVEDYAYKVGGLIGSHGRYSYNKLGNISNSIFTGAVNGGNSSYTGGITGTSYGNVFIINSINAGSITAARGNVGGIAGQIHNNIVNCYNVGSVSNSGNSSNKVGGIVGFIDSGYVKNCYNAGIVSNPGGAIAGALVADLSSYDTAGNLYSDITVNPSMDPINIINGTSYYLYNLTTEEMTGAAPSQVLEYGEGLNASGIVSALNGWIDEFDYSEADIVFARWDMDSSVNSGYPYLVGVPMENNAELDSLSITEGTLSPSFSKDIDVYEANVPNSTDELSITAIARSENASISINGETVSTSIVQLAVGNNTIEIIVTAENGVTTNSYTVNITRAATSSSGGSSTPTGQQVTVSTPDGETVVTGTLTESGNTEQITISGTQFRTLANANKGAMIPAQYATVTFDAKAMDTINGASSTGDVVLTIEKLDQSTLTPEQQKRIGDRPVYDFTLTKGGKQITHFNGGHAKISIPYTLKDGENPHQVVIYYLTSDGTLKPVRGHYDANSKCVIFETTHFSAYAVGYNPVSFNDVAAGVWYKDAIDFIAAREITSGTSVGEFSPEATLTRGQFTVLLMNAYGINPDAVEEGTANFVDAGNTYYTNYLLAAKSLGIVNGIGNNMFAPEQAITRQEMFVMLYNALEVIEELPQASGDKQLSDFGDANQVASWAQEAMNTLIKGGVISGSNGMLTPTASTTRAQMAQMLYNLLSK